MENTIGKRTEEFVESLENILNVAFQASGMSFTDVLLNMDDDMAPVLLSTIETYKLSKDYMIEQAKMFDTMAERLEKLEERSKKDDGLLEDIDRNIESINGKLDRINEILSKKEEA